MSPTTTPTRPGPSGRETLPVAIDPRLSARRTEVIRQRGRRRLWVVGVVVAVAVVAFGMWCLLHSSIFSARAITVVGGTHETASQIESAAGMGSRPPLLDINAAAAALDLERLPWVRSASVSVHWPDGVRIAVTERVASLVMSTANGQWAEISAGGRILADVTTRPPGLMAVTGPEQAGPPGSTLGVADQRGVLVASTLPVSFRAQVASVNVQAGGWVQLAMTTPILVDIGDSSQLAAKYEDVTAVLAGATLHNGDIIDVSVPSAPSVTGP